MKTLLLTCIFGTMFFALKAQIQDEDLFVQNALELIQEQHEDVDVTLLAQELIDLKQHPINLNTVSLKQLENIPFIHSIHAAKIIEYRQKYGRIRSYSELLRIGSIDREMAELIQHFSILENQKDANHLTQTKIKTEINFLSFLSFPKSIGFGKNDRQYPGLPQRYLARATSEINTRLKAGLVMEQDPGEAIKSMPDFVSGHIQWKPKTTVFRKIILGDYHLHYAQNLLIGPSFSFGKSINLATWFRTQNKIKPNTSSAEYGFRRGLAAEIEHKRLHSIVFVSNEPLDFASNLSTNNISGLHRTPTEVNRRHNANQTIIGIVNTLHYSKLDLGLGLYVGNRFARDTDDKIHYNFLSINLKYRLQNGMVYSELVRDMNQSVSAYQAGCIFSLAPFLNFASIYRNYPLQFSNPLANALSSQSRTQNEEGFLTGLEWKMSKAFTIQSYFDHYNTLNRKELPSFSTENTDFVMQLKWSKKRRWDWYIRYRNRLKNDKELSEHSSINPKHTARMHFAYMATASLRLAQRIEYNLEQKDKGMLMYIDLQWRPKSTPWALDLRYTLFDVDNYSQRVYAYESSLPYTFSIPAHFNTGSRSYCRMRYKGFKKCDIWLYYGVWKYTDLQSISSGNNLIESNRKREVGINLRYRL